MRKIAAIIALACGVWLVPSQAQQRGLLVNRPSPCNPGDTYFAFDQAAGSQQYVCTAANVWALFSGSGAAFVWPSAGIMTSTGSAAGASLAAPVGAVVGTTDTQTLTGKTVDGVAPATMAYLDATSSIQGQLNGKQASVGTGTTGQYFRGDLSLATFPVTGGTISLSGNLATTGAFNPTFAIPSSSTWTFPAAGTLIGSADSGTVTGTMLSASTITALSSLASANGSTIPSSGGTLIGSGNMSQDCTITTAGVITCLKSNNVALGLYATASGAINPQTATYQVLASDFAGLKTIAVASGTFTITLVASSGQPAAGQYINVVNYGTGSVTIARSGQDINGATTSIGLPGTSNTPFPASALIWSDGTNYFAAVNEGSNPTFSSMKSGQLLTTSNCSSAAAPAACGSAPSGSVVVAASATTVVVDSTAITANSQVQLTFDSSLGTKLSVTCNTTPVQATVSARTAATSFTITVPTAPTTNPACFSYTIIN